MTNKSEQDGNGSKTIEISDMKYHIFQVCGPPGSGGLPQGPRLCAPGLRGSWELAVILHSVPAAFCVCRISDQVRASGSFSGQGGLSGTGL